MDEQDVLQERRTMEHYTRGGGGGGGLGWVMRDIVINKTVCRTPGPMVVATFAVSPDLRTTEKFMVTTTVLMTFLGAALFAVGVFGRFSGRHRGHSSATRIFFRASFALFLPFMSFMFSQAKSKDLPFRAYLILLWMLLVELLRKKVFAMVAPAGDTFSRGVGRYSFFDAVEDAARMVWIGYLIYSYVHGFAVKSMFIILWIFSVAKLCKRAVCIHLAKRSFDLAKNATLVSGYMAQLVGEHRQLELQVQVDDDGDVRGNSTMRACNYTVMGESDLKINNTPHGFEIDGLQDILAAGAGAGADGGGTSGEAGNGKTEKLVRVSTIWKLAERDPLFKYNVHRKQKLEDICLGMALYKLLRRRIERCHMAEKDTREARTFVVKGLLALGGDQGEAADAKRAFDVVEMELRFLVEYYQAIIPLALPRPGIFVANFVFSVVFILLYCIAVLLVTGNGNIFRVLGSLFRGFIGISIDMVVQFRCFRHQVSALVGMVCSSSDLIVTFLLTLTLFSVETYELAQYLLSDWFAVSMLCNYARNPGEWKQLSAQRAVRSGLWVRHRSRPVIKAHQVTMLKLHHLHPRRMWMLASRILSRRLAGLRPAVVTTEAKVAIVAALKAFLLESGGGAAGDLQFHNCVAVLRRHGFQGPEWACDSSKGAATVILVWHLATALLETGGEPLPRKGEAAVTLSRYCAYLVSYEPGLLPDDPEWTEKAYNDVKAGLGSFFRSCCTTVDRREKLVQFRDDWEEEASAMARGIKLGKLLEDRASESPDEFDKVWTMLLEFWAELLVVVAQRPSAGPEGHALALANGGEFITHIWAMITHAGVRVHRHHDYQSFPVTHVV